MFSSHKKKHFVPYNQLFAKNGFLVC